MKKNAMKKILSLLMAAGLIYLIAGPASGTEIKLIKCLLAPYGEGLAWDGTHLWVADSTGGYIYKIDPSDGDVIESFEHPGTYLYGGDLAFDGEYLWLANYAWGGYGRELIKIDPLSGLVVDKINLELNPRISGFISGLTWGDGALWIHASATISKIDPVSGSVLGQFIDPEAVEYGDGNVGLAWATNRENPLWLSYGYLGSGKGFYEINPQSRDITNFISYEDAGEGFTFDGKYFWSNCYLEGLCQFDLLDVPEDAVYFPHIASGSNWETEIALINSSTIQVINGNLIAYDNFGTQLASLPISLNASGRREIIVGEEFSSAIQIGYLVFQSDYNICKGYTKFYIDGVYRVAVPAVSTVNTGNIYVSHIASTADWWTGVSLVNTTSSTKVLTIEFDNGENKTKTLAANEHSSFTIRSLFSEQAQPDIQSAVIKNGSGVVGLELFGSTSASGNNYLSGILLKDDLTTRMHYPHIASDSMWWTGVVAYNPSTFPCNITITPYSAEGAALLSQDLTINGMGKYIGTVADLDLPVDTAWFQVEATSPISGFELFGTRDGNQLGGYTGVDISGKGGIFAKLEKYGWTGIAFVNSEDTLATVTLTAYDDNGSTVATETISLDPHEKVVNLTERIFTQDINTASYIGYSSNKEVVGFQLNGSADNMLLDALPGM